MSITVQVCVVVLTVGLVGLIIYAIRVSKRLETMLEDATRTSVEVRELVNSLDKTSKSSHAILANVEKISHRALQISNSVMDEVDAPVMRVVKLVRGVKAASGVLIERWRPGRKTSHVNGGGRNVYS